MVSGAVPALILVGGLALLAARFIPDAGKAIDETGKAIQKGFDEFGAGVQEGIEGAGRAIDEFGAGVQEGINEGLEGVQEGFNEFALGVQQGFDQAGQGLSSFVDGLFAPPPAPEGKGTAVPEPRRPVARQPGRRGA